MWDSLTEGGWSQKVITTETNMGFIVQQMKYLFSNILCIVGPITWYTVT